jgi:hypothetical protein
MVTDTWLPHLVTEGLRMLVKCGERVGTKVLKVLNMRMCKITDEVCILNLGIQQMR